MVKASAPIVLAIALFLNAPQVAQAPRKAEAITDKTPYYMCFAYTQDGLLFAGGDFNFRRASHMLATNCGMPKALKVVLVKTIMSHDRKATLVYNK